MLFDFEEIKNKVNTTKYYGTEAWYEILNAIADCEVKSRPQGEWIFRTIFPNDKSEFPMGYLECPICGSTHANKTPCNFCDDCGAKLFAKGINVPNKKGASDDNEK